jgi:ferrous iron transport protein B
VLEITNKVVLCLNLIDEAKRHNIKINQRSLARDLGIPVVATIARTKEGIPELLQTINKIAKGTIICKPHKVKNLTKSIEGAVDQLSKKIKEQFPDLDNSRWVAFRLLEGDKRITNAVLNNELNELSTT